MRARLCRQLDMFYKQQLKRYDDENGYAIKRHSSMNSTCFSVAVTIFCRVLKGSAKTFFEAVVRRGRRASLI